MYLSSLGISKKNSHDSRPVDEDTKIVKFEEIYMATTQDENHASVSAKISKISQEIPIIQGKTSEKPEKDSDETYTCYVCNKSYAENKNLRRHLRLHIKGDLVVCLVCDGEFSDWSNVKEHMKSHTGNKPYKCPDCGRSFAQNSAFRTHRKKATLACPRKTRRVEEDIEIVDFKGIDISSVKRENRPPMSVTAIETQGNSLEQEVKEKKGSEKNEESSNQTYTCSCCDKSYAENKNLRRHLRLHIRGDLVVCLVCDDGFSEWSDLKEHMKSHTGNKPFKCSDCGRSFAQSNAYRTHRRKPTFACPRKTRPVEEDIDIVEFKGIDISSVKQENHPAMSVKAIETEENPLKQEVEERNGSEKTEESFNQTYTCSCCDKSYVENKSLRRHLRSHIRGELVVCLVCDDEFSEWSNLKEHMKSHTGNKPFKCPDCGRSFAQNNAYRTHRRKPTFACPRQTRRVQEPTETVESKEIDVSSVKQENHPSVSVKVIETQGNLLKQELKEKDGREKSKENSDQTHTCSCCDKSYVENKSLKRHLRLHIKGDLVICLVCDDEFSEWGDLKEHMKSHTGSRPYQCPDCERYFARTHAFRRHRRKRKEKDTSFICPLCNKQLCTAKSLTYHVRKHRGARPFPCHLCKRRYADRYALSLHLKIHNGERPSYTCAQCGKSFTTQGNLTSHLLLHTDERNFCCHECGKTFYHNSVLRKHLESHSEVRRYACLECGQQFMHQANLTRHYKVHSMDTPYECDQCKKRFKRRDNLKQHLITHKNKGKRRKRRKRMPDGTLQ